MVLNPRSSTKCMCPWFNIFQFSKTTQIKVKCLCCFCLGQSFSDLRSTQLYDTFWQRRKFVNIGTSVLRWDVAVVLLLVQSIYILTEFWAIKRLVKAYSTFCQQESILLLLFFLLLLLNIAQFDLLIPWTVYNISLLKNNTWNDRPDWSILLGPQSRRSFLSCHKSPAHDHLNLSV